MQKEKKMKTVKKVYTLERQSPQPHTSTYFDLRKK